MPKNFYEVAWIFFIYSFLGWVCEVIFMALTTGQFMNRGFLFGTLCPIYGFGMLAIIYTLYPLRGNVFILFIGAVVLTTLLELSAGFVLEKVFHEKWWDYSDVPFNFHGYICLKFSVLWGIGGTLAVGAVHPLIYRVIEKVPQRFGWSLLIFVFVWFTADLVITVVTIIKLPKRLHAMLEAERTLQLLSDKIGLSISGATIAAANKGGELMEEQKARLAKLREEYEKKLAEFKSLSGKWLSDNRIFKAFPDLQNGRFKRLFERIHKDDN